VSSRHIPTWKKLKQGVDHQFSVLRVREDEVESPRTGSTSARVVLEMPDWVNVIPVTADGKVVMIRQFRFGIWSPTLEIPGGIVESGEDPAHAAARELEEETGYRPASMRPLGWVHPNPALQDNKCHTFLAEGCERVNPGSQDPTEDIIVELHGKAEIADLIRTGEIRHSLVISALYLHVLAPVVG